MTNFHPQMSLPQVVQINGQFYYIPDSAFVHRPFMQAQLQQAQIHAQPHQAQPQLHLQQLPLPAPQIREPEPNVDLGTNSNDYGPGQLELEQQIPQTKQVASVAKTNKKLKSKAKNIKGDQFIAHYIDNQLIIETPELIHGMKKKKKKKLLGQNQNLANLQTVPAQQQQQQTQQPQQQLQQQSQQQQQQVAQSSIKRDIAQAPASPAIVSAQSANEQDNQPEAAVTAIDSDILQSREEMKTWSVAQVAVFIKSQESISAYSSKFAEDEIDGTALLHMIDRNLNIQVLSTMFKYGPAMKIEAALSKYKLKE